MQTLSMTDTYSHPGFGVVLESILHFLEQAFKPRADPSSKGISPSCRSSSIPASESDPVVSAFCLTSPLMLGVAGRGASQYRSFRCDGV